MLSESQVIHELVLAISIKEPRGITPQRERLRMLSERVDWKGVMLSQTNHRSIFG